MKTSWIFYFLLMGCFILIGLGLFSGEYNVVFQTAISICLSCIGIS